MQRKGQFQQQQQQQQQPVQAVPVQSVPFQAAQRPQPNGSGKRKSRFKDRDGDGEVDFYDVILTIVEWIRRAFAVPAIVVADTLSSFVTMGETGSMFVASLFFICGMIASADSIYEMFAGKGLIPIAWEGRENLTMLDWVGMLTNPMALLGLLLAICAAAAITVMEGMAIRGSELSVAKAEFNEVRNERVPDVARDAISIAKLRAERIENAGMGEEHSFGFAIVIVFLADIYMTFSSRPVWGLPPNQMIGLILVNLFLMIMGETGFVLYKKATRARKARQRAKQREAAAVASL